MPSSNNSLIKRVESGHVLTAADMAALKTPPPGSARSRSQLSGNGSHGTMGSLHGPRSMNAIQAEGYSQRIDVERHTLAAQARLPSSASLLKFVADNDKKLHFGSHYSAGAAIPRILPGGEVVGLRGGPRGRIEADCRHPSLVEEHKARGYGANPYFNKKKLSFESDESVQSCLFTGSHWHTTTTSKRAELAELKRAIKTERAACRKLYKRAEQAGVALTPLDHVAPIPDDWFEAVDADRNPIWMHVRTKHAVRERPTPETPIQPIHDAEAAATALPPNWFETRDGSAFKPNNQGRTIWRNLETGAVSYARPNERIDAHLSSTVKSVFVPGRDPPKSMRPGLEALARLRSLEKAASAPTLPAIPLPTMDDNKGKKVKGLAKTQTGGSRVLIGFNVDESSAKPVPEQLRDALRKHAIKVMDLFREWCDADAPRTRRRRAAPHRTRPAPHPAPNPATGTSTATARSPRRSSARRWPSSASRCRAPSWTRSSTPSTPTAAARSRSRSSSAASTSRRAPPARRRRRRRRRSSRSTRR